MWEPHSERHTDRRCATLIFSSSNHSPFFLLASQVEAAAARRSYRADAARCSSISRVAAVCHVHIPQLPGDWHLFTRTRTDAWS